MPPDSQRSLVGHITRCYHGRSGREHVYEPGESCPPYGPIVQGDCPGCGAPHGYRPAGPCLNHGSAGALALVQEHPLGELGA